MVLKKDDSYDNCRYVNKSIVKTLMREIKLNFMDTLAKSFKIKYGKGICWSLVGSAKRRLVVQKGNSPWDLDYNLCLEASIYKEDIDLFELKLFVKSKLEKICGNNYSVNMSTSAITVLKKKGDKNGFKGFDIALIIPSKNLILRGKVNDKTSVDNVKWESLKTENPWIKGAEKIKGAKQWNILRSKFIQKKCDQPKDATKNSYSLFLEVAKETIDSITSKMI